MIIGCVDWWGTCDVNEDEGVSLPGLGHDW